MFFSKELYIAVQLHNEDNATKALSHYDRDHREDDLCSPFSDEKNVRIYYYSSIEASEIEDITELLVTAKIPFKAFHSSSLEGEHGWIVGRLADDGSISTQDIIKDGEMIYIDDVNMILAQATSLEDAKQQIAALMKKQEVPIWD